MFSLFLRYLSTVENLVSHFRFFCSSFCTKKMFCFLYTPQLLSLNDYAKKRQRTYPMDIQYELDIFPGKNRQNADLIRKNREIPGKTKKCLRLLTHFPTVSTPNTRKQIFVVTNILKSHSFSQTQG